MTNRQVKKGTARKERPFRLRVGPTSIEPDKHGCPNGFYAVHDRGINVELPSPRSETGKTKKPRRKGGPKEEPDPTTIVPVSPRPVKERWGTGRPSEMDDDGIDVEVPRPKPKKG